jgi:dimethylglycine dehydrogenase
MFVVVRSIACPSQFYRCCRTQAQVTLEIDSRDADAWGYEQICYKEEYAGFVTSGAYGHTVKKSLAKAYLKTQFLDDSTNEFSVHVVDERRSATVIAGAPYDPSGTQMRS